MFPGYKPLLNKFALKHITRPIHNPDFTLGVYPFEILTNVTNLGFSRTMPDLRRNIVHSNAPAMGQNYEGIPGWGALVPEVETGGTPYFGESLYQT